MTRLLIAYDGSEPARAALGAAAALFGGAEAVIATVQPPLASFEAAAMARVAVPDSMIRIGIENLRAENEREGSERVAEGVELASGAGLVCSSRILHHATPWRALRALGEEVAADIIVCGTRGEGPLDRALLGSTAASLLHHAERPLLVVPAGPVELDGPVLAGYDQSEGARAALRFAAAHLAARRVVIAHAWRSPVRHSLRGRALAHSGVDLFEDYAKAVDDIWSEIAAEAADEGVAYAHELGLEAEPAAPESRSGPSHALVGAAAEAGATVVLVGSRGRGAVASTILGSVATGVVNAAALPVLVIPSEVHT
jgi:nucleotide-binding universal stress UspA family protein